MPALSNHHSAQVTKALIIANSGSGKTGGLASLVQAGYNVRVIDFDNGLDVLANVLPKEFHSKVQFVTCTDEFHTVGGKVQVKGVPKAFNKAMQMLSNWKDGDVDLGPVSSWGPQDVLVIDSLTHCGKAAMRATLALNNRLNQHPHQSDWGVAQNSLEDLIAMLCSDAIKCNVLVLAHYDVFGDSDDQGKPIGPQRGLPISLGKALSPKIPSYFNSVLLIQTVGSGPGLRRELHTIPQGLIELKSSAPKSVKAKYPLETGYADYFAAVRG
jgi:hypothetical protein